MCSLKFLSNKWSQYNHQIEYPQKTPGDLGVSSQVQLIQTPKEQENLCDKPYCKHCGSILPEGQSTCSNCGKKVI